MSEVIHEPSQQSRAGTPSSAGNLLSIAATERATGIARETLRMWERRYGFPRPNRDDNGNRQYPREQVEQLQLVKRALSLGHRPGALLSQPPSAWHGLAGTPAHPDVPPMQRKDSFNERWLPILKQHDALLLRQSMRRELEGRGLRSFAVDSLAPALRGLGDAWHEGAVAIFEEHQFTQVANSVLGEAIAGAAPVSPRTPHVLLTTLPGERHGLGLLLVEAVLHVNGADCQSLGTETPVEDIAAAVQSMGIDIVALSCSPCVAAARLIGEITRLRALLPLSAEIWTGGSAPALRRVRLDGVHVFDALEPLDVAMASWRSRHASPEGSDGRGERVGWPAATGAALRPV